MYSSKLFYFILFYLIKLTTQCKNIHDNSSFCWTTSKKTQNNMNNNKAFEVQTSKEAIVLVEVAHFTLKWVFNIR